MKSVASRWAITTVCAGAFVLTACSAGTSSQGEAQPVTASQAAATQVASMSKAEAKDYFLMVVCPVTTSLKIVDNLSIEAGGWPAVKPAAAKPYTTAAADAVRKASTQLVAPDKVWPSDVAPSVEAMSTNFLEMIVPLQAMANAPTGAAMEEPWNKVALNPRTAEQQARIDLGLPAANAAKDGCPPVPRAKPKPTTLPKPSGGSNSASGGGQDNWQSPSGNLRCAYFAEGSQGPSVACLDSDNNQLVILNEGFTRSSSASSSQRAQLPGGRVQDFGDAPRVIGGRFACGLTDVGMTCQSISTQVYFVIRRGYLYTSDGG